MKNLLPRSAYDDDGSLSWLRVGLLVGLPFGAVMALFGFFGSGGRVSPSQAPGVGLLTSALFAVSWILGIRFMISRMLDRLYAGDPKLLGEIPEAEGFTHRVGCSLMTSPGFAVGGMLYTGPAEWRFIPHRKNLPRHRQPLRIAPLTETRLELHPMPLRGLQKWTTVRALDLLRIHWPGGTADFRVPAPGETIALLERQRSTPTAG